MMSLTEKGWLTFTLEEASIYELNNLPVEEQKFLQHYFDLIREGYQDYVDGTNTLDAPTYLVKALMQHIARIVREWLDFSNSFSYIGHGEVKNFI